MKATSSASVTVAGLPVVKRVQVADALQQQEDLLVAQGPQLDDRTRHVNKAVPGEAAAPQAGPQGLVAEQAAALVL